LRREVAFAQLAVEEIEDQAVQTVSKFRVVAQAFVAHEGVCAVDVVPGETCTQLVETGEDLHTSFRGDVWILTAPNHEQLAFNFRGALKGVVMHAFAEAAFVDIGGVETGGGLDVGVHGGAEGKVAANADAHRA
jgi:hypothetical protein